MSTQHLAFSAFASPFESYDIPIAVGERLLELACDGAQGVVVDRMMHTRFGVEMSGAAPVSVVNVAERVVMQTERAPTRFAALRDVVRCPENPRATMVQRRERDGRKRARNPDVRCLEARDHTMFLAALLVAIQETLRHDESIDALPCSVGFALCSSTDRMMEHHLAPLLRHSSDAWVNACVSVQVLRACNESGDVHRAMQAALHDAKRRGRTRMNYVLCGAQVYDISGRVNIPTAVVSYVQLSMASYTCISDFMRQCRLRASECADTAEQHRTVSPQRCVACVNAHSESVVDWDTTVLRLHLRLRDLLSGDADLIKTTERESARCQFCAMLRTMCAIVLRYISSTGDSNSLVCRVGRTTEPTDPADPLTELTRSGGFPVAAVHTQDVHIPLECMFRTATHIFRYATLLMQVCHSKLGGDGGRAAAYRMRERRPHFVPILGMERTKLSQQAHKTLHHSLSAYSANANVSITAYHFDVAYTFDVGYTVAVHNSTMACIAHGESAHHAHTSAMLSATRDTVRTASNAHAAAFVATCTEDEQHGPRTTIVGVTPVVKFMGGREFIGCAGHGECCEGSLRPMPGFVHFLRAMACGDDYHAHSGVQWLFSQLFSVRGRTRDIAMTVTLRPTDNSFSLYRLLPLLVNFDAGTDGGLTALRALWDGIQQPYIDANCLVYPEEMMDIMEGMTGRSLGAQAVVQHMDTAPTDGLGAELLAPLPSTRSNSADTARRLIENSVLLRLMDMSMYDASHHGRVDEAAECHRIAGLANSAVVQEQSGEAELDDMDVDTEPVAPVRRVPVPHADAQHAPPHEAEPNDADEAEPNDADDDSMLMSEIQDQSLSVMSDDFVGGLEAWDARPLTAQPVVPRRAFRRRNTGNSVDQCGRVVGEHAMNRDKVLRLDTTPFYAGMLAFLAPRAVRVTVTYALMEDVWYTLLQDTTLWIEHRHLATLLIELLCAERDYVYQERRRGLPTWLVWRRMRARYIRWSTDRHVAEGAVAPHTDRYSWVREFEEDDPGTHGSDEREAGGVRRRVRVRTRKVARDSCQCRRCGEVSCKKPLPTRLHVIDGVWGGDGEDGGMDLSTDEGFWRCVDEAHGPIESYQETSRVRGMRAAPVLQPHQLYDPLCSLPPRPDCADDDAWTNVNFRVRFRRSATSLRRFGDDEKLVMPTRSKLLPDLRTPLHFLFYLLAADPRTPTHVQTRIFRDVLAVPSRQLLQPVAISPLGCQAAQHREAHEVLGRWCQKNTGTPQLPAICDQLAPSCLEWLSTGCRSLDPWMLEQGTTLPFAPLAFMSASLELMRTLTYRECGAAHPQPAGFLGHGSTRNNADHTIVLSLFDPEVIRRMIARTDDLPFAYSWRDLQTGAALDEPIVLRTSQMMPLYDSPFTKRCTATARFRRAVTSGHVTKTTGPFTHASDALIASALAYPITHVDTRMIGTSFVDADRLRDQTRDSIQYLYLGKRPNPGTGYGDVFHTDLQQCSKAVHV